MPQGKFGLINALKLEGAAGFSRGRESIGI